METVSKKQYTAEIEIRKLYEEANASTERLLNSREVVESEEWQELKEFLQCIGSEMRNA